MFKYHLYSLLFELRRTMQPLTFKHILKFQVLMLLPNPIHLHPISKQNRAQRGEIVFFAMLLFSLGINQDLILKASFSSKSEATKEIFVK